MAKTIRIAAAEAQASSPVALEKAEELVGSTVADRYKVEAVMTASETGAIYRAAHVHLRKRVALKVVYAGAPEAEIARLEREAVAGAHVQHPNVAGATDTGVLPDGGRYLTVEHIAGAPLSEVLRLGPMSAERAVRIARQLAGALSASHQQGIVHRNVEPRNVMLTGQRGDDARLLDFGRAKVDVSRFGQVPSTAPEEDLTNRTVVLTTTGIIEWSTAYLPPEAVLGSSVLDERADLYSLGVVLFEMLAGKRPFEAEEPAALFAEQRQQRLPRVSERSAGVVIPEELEQVLARLLAIERTSRFESAAALVAALEAIESAGGLARSKDHAKAGPSPAGRTGATTGGQSVRRAREAIDDLQHRLRGILRNPGAWPALSVLVACVLGLALWIGFSSEPKKPVARDTSEELELDQPVARRPLPSASPSGSTVVGSASAQSPLMHDGFDANGWRSELSTAVGSENWGRAGQAIVALGRLEPSAFKERGVGASVVSAATALETAGGKQADAVFTVLESGLGTDGLWLLFEIVRTKGGTKGSERAARMLAAPDADKRAPAALRIALLLVTTPCAEKAALFERAVEEGDERSLTALRALREMDNCPRRRPNPCCFKHNEQLATAIEQLAQRLAKR